MSDHKHGEMDISVQEEAFGGFIKWCVRVAVFSILALVFIALVNA